MSEKTIGNRHKQRRLISLTIVLILVLTGLVGYVFLQDRFQFDSAAENGTLDGMSQSEIEEMMKQKVDESMLSISINSSPEFENGNSKGTLRIENSVKNRYNLKVKITRTKDKKQLYYSDAIKPGQVIKEDKLDVKLPKGSYECSAVFEAYDTESNRKVGEAEALLTIYIKN